MTNRTRAFALSLFAILFIVLDFTVGEAGTISLILAVAAGLGAAYYFRSP